MSGNHNKYQEEMSEEIKGWKLVPVEPTDKQLSAAERANRGYMMYSFERGYIAAIEASPTPPQEPDDLFPILMSFYNVDSLSALVRAQQEHIQSLQNKLYELEPKPLNYRKVREG